MEDEHDDERSAPIEHPDFEVPEGALEAGVPREEPKPPVSTTPAATPPVPPAPPAAAPAAAPPAAAPGTPSAPPAPPEGHVPLYRLNEVTERERAAKAEVARLTAEIAALRAAPPAPPAAPPPAAAAPEPPNPQDVAIRERLEALYPGLKKLGDLAKLAERSGDIDGAIAASASYQADVEKFFDRHTSTQLSNLHTQAATHMLGEGKTAADLSEIAKETLTTSFARWVGSDPERTARYNDLDTNLVGEFWQIYKAAMLDPVTRAHSAATITTAENRPPMPVGGSVAAPVAPAPPKPPDLSDEDAVHERAWHQLQGSLGR